MQHGNPQVVGSGALADFATWAASDEGGGKPQGFLIALYRLNI